MYKAGEMKVNQYFAKLEKAFNQTKRELQKTLESFYWRYAEENGLTYAEAQKRLDKAEIGELNDFINLVMQNIGKYNQTVNNMSIKARITRYQALEAQVDALLRQLYAVDYEAMANQTMKEVYGDTYYQTWYNIDQYRGFHSAFAQVDPAVVDKLLEYPFNGANFSTRLWKQKDHLQTVLMESLTTMMVQGVPPQNLAADFAKKMNSKKFEAYRLLHTESSFLMSEATHAGYKEDGVEKYEIVATLDSKTCGVCGEMDRKVYPVEEAITGKNMPPFHCFCRCTDVPRFDDTDRSDMTRAARDADGNPIEVPADMTYKEWKEQFIDSDITVNSSEEQIREYLDELNNKKIEWLKDHSYDIYGDTVEEMEKGFWEEAEDGSMPGESRFMKSINRKIDNMYQKLGYKNIVADGKKSYTKIIKGKHSIEDDLKAINPNYEPSSYKWASNCQRCVPAYEMRRRGFDVVAKPRKKGKDDTASSWRTIFKDAQWEKCGTNRKESTIKNIVDNMQKYGDGSRAEIYVVWRNGRSSHVFVAENDGGNIRFIDPQSNKGDVMGYFDQCRTTATEMCRIDNLETTELIKGCCE